MSPNPTSPAGVQRLKSFLGEENRRMKDSDGMSPTVSIPLSVLVGLGGVLAFQETILIFLVPAMLLSLVFGALISFKDLKTRRVPDAYTLPWTAGLVAALVLTAVILPEGGAMLGQAALLAAAHTGFYLLLLVCKATSMGDVKLSVPLGLLIAPFGAGPLLWAVALAAATGLVHGFVLKRRGHKSYPAAPHMVVAGLFVTTALVLTELSQAFA